MIGSAIIYILQKLTQCQPLHARGWPLILGACFVAAAMFPRGGVYPQLLRLWRLVSGARSSASESPEGHAGREVMEVRNVAKTSAVLPCCKTSPLTCKQARRQPLSARTAPGKPPSLISSPDCLGLLPAASLSGHDLTKLTPNGRVALGVSRSFQISSLFPGLSVFESMLMAPFGLQREPLSDRPRSFSSYEENNARASELLEGADLWLAKDTPVSDLSDGEKRRLDIALSLSPRPKILLLDEPTPGWTGPRHRA